MDKQRIFLLIALFVSVLTTVSNVEASYAIPTSLSPYDPAQDGLPATIAGYKVLAVSTPSNTACMLPGAKRVILQAPQQSVEGYLKDSRPDAITKDIEQYEIDRTTKWEVMIVGPGTTLEEFLGENSKWNRQGQNYGCTKSLPPKTGTNGTEVKIPSSYPSYAEFEDTGAGSFANDNAQSVYLIAPTSIANRPKALLFLNNVKTDNSTYYLLQNGLQFYNGLGSVVWTDTTKGYVNQTYNIPYVASHTYWVTITFTSGIWQMCAVDVANPECVNRSVTTFFRI
jgi:hypothetical protein